MSAESQGVIQSATQYILTQKCAERSGFALSFDGKRYSLKIPHIERCVCRNKKIDILKAFLEGVEFARGDNE